MNDTIKFEIRNKCLAGMTCEEITKDLNINRNKVYYVLSTFDDYEFLKETLKNTKEKRLMEYKLEVRNKYISGKSCEEIATELSFVKEEVYHILRTFDDYEELKKDVNEKRNKFLNEKIKDLYFLGNKKGVEIAKTLEVSQAYVTKVIKNCDKYESEKQTRHIKSVCKNKISKQLDYTLKKKKFEEDAYILANLAREQELNAIASSRKSKISSNGIIKICIQEYKMNKKNKLVFDEKNGKKPNDLPKEESKPTYKPLKKGKYKDDYLMH